MMGLILVAAASAMALALGRGASTWAAKRTVRAGLGRFAHDPVHGTFEEARPRLRLPGPRHAHAVLLIHGYSASPACFDELCAALDAARVPYYAPTLTGFGLDDLGLIEAARAADWRRDVRDAYALLRTVAEEVSVVGMSFGARLAADLVAEVPVRDLVLVSPYFAPAKGTERAVRRVLASPALRAAIAAVMPYYRKPRRAGRVANVDLLDPEAARRAFHYQALPLRSLAELATFEERATPAVLRAERIAVVYGGRDETSDVPAYLGYLDALGVAYDARCFAASDHGVLEDGERVAACRHVATLLGGVP